MAELRQDPVTGRWVAIAPERAGRPLTGAQDDPSACPFCPGHEALTLPEVLAHRPAGSPPDGPAWQLRVVPNKFAAFRPEGRSVPEGPAQAHHMEAVGVAEVVVEAPEHAARFPQLPPEHARGVVEAWAQRYATLGRDPRFQHVQVFRNAGAGAGASLAHPHSQVIATHALAPRIVEKLAGAWRYRQATGGCPWCDQIEAEARARERVVLETPGYLAIVPYACGAPHAVTILPRRHGPSFAAIAPGGVGGTTVDERAEFAHLLQDVLGRLARALSDPPHQLVLQSVLPRLPLPDFHWHAEVWPVRDGRAGFETGTGLIICDVAPEEAAARLRGA